MKLALDTKNSNLVAVLDLTPAKARQIVWRIAEIRDLAERSKARDGCNTASEVRFWGKDDPVEFFDDEVLDNLGDTPEDWLFDIETFEAEGYLVLPKNFEVSTEPECDLVEEIYITDRLWDVDCDCFISWVLYATDPNDNEVRTVALSLAKLWELAGGMEAATSEKGEPTP